MQQLSQDPEVSQAMYALAIPLPWLSMKPWSVQVAGSYCVGLLRSYEIIKG